MQPTSLATVWVVDDDEDDQLFIRTAFANSEPSVSVLSLMNGAHLLSKLANCNKLPQLILLDVNMPVKNGFEALAELRNIPEFADLPVVMLTTSSAEVDSKRAYALGANQFLTKPLSFDQLQGMAQELSQRWVLID